MKGTNKLGLIVVGVSSFVLGQITGTGLTKTAEFGLAQVSTLDSLEYYTLKTSMLIRGRV